MLSDADRRTALWTLYIHDRKSPMAGCSNWKTNLRTLSCLSSLVRWWLNLKQRSYFAHVILKCCYYWELAKEDCLFVTDLFLQRKRLSRELLPWSAIFHFLCVHCHDKPVATSIRRWSIMFPLHKLSWVSWIYASYSKFLCFGSYQIRCSSLTYVLVEKNSSTYHRQS